jgi:cytochrome c556
MIAMPTRFLLAALAACACACSRDCPPQAAAPAAATTDAAIAINAVQHEMQTLHAAMQATLTGIAYGDVRGVPAAFEAVDQARQATEAAIESGTYVLARNADHAADFRALDEAFHTDLERLVTAARKNDVPATSEAFGAAIARCQPCHAQFRK